MKRTNEPREIRRLKSKAKKAGITLDVTQYIDKKHQNCLWYGGEVASAIRGDLELTIIASGDVIAELTDKNGEFLAYSKDKCNCGRFYDEMKQYIPTDQMLRKTLQTDRLQLINNNWFEWAVFDHSKNRYIGPSCFDNIFDEDNLLVILGADSLNGVFDYATMYDEQTESKGDEQNDFE